MEAESEWRSAFTSLLVVLVVYLGAIYYYKHAFAYWKKRGVPSLPPRVFYGNMPMLFGFEQIGWLVMQQYHQLKALGHRHGGFYFFTIPHYIPIDPQIIKCIMQQDFQHFTERGLYYNEKDDPISASMVTFGGERWKSLRARLSPAFTPIKIKRTFDIVVECGYQMQKALENLSERQKTVDIFDITTCYTTDVIGSCAFGLECNSFADLDSDIIKYAKKAMGLSLVRLFKVGLSFVCPNWMLKMGIRTFDQGAAKFFQNVVAQTVQFRKANNVVRNDLLQLLIELQDECDEKSESQSSMTLKEVVANVFSFFVAGYETASVTMAFCLYELSTNLEVQDKLREEIGMVLDSHGGKLTYESLPELKYMGQVIDETLRKYPPFAVITRQCSKDYHIPDTKTILEKGTLVMIPVVGLHRDGEYFPEPEKFDPDRFFEERKKLIEPFTYLPFGEGPRICIGARLAVMEIKIGLAIILQRYRFTLNRSTVIPVQIDPLNLITTPKTNICLNLEKLSNCNGLC